MLDVVSQAELDVEAVVMEMVMIPRSSSLSEKWTFCSSSVRKRTRFPTELWCIWCKEED